MQSGQLRWRCQRGSRELELMLLAYLERRYPLAVAIEQAAFQRLLELPEDRLQRCLLGQDSASTDVDMTRLAKQIRAAFNAHG